MKEEYKNNLLKHLAKTGASDSDTKTVMEFAESISNSKNHADFVEKELAKEKPRVNFCWHCARKLRGDSFTEYDAGYYGIVVVHLACKTILRGWFRSRYRNRR